mmetsp:Transcript_23501/g.65842  ORF Transcript_23501/g.65842 Transcript_23501/m.65842 type:complete len:461 (-) Transcript_23501:525-1907(-)
MGNSITRNYMCCTTRDKYPGMPDAAMLSRPPQFRWAEAEVELEDACLMAFAPLHQREEHTARRIAVASPREVQVYRVLNDFDLISDLQVVLTHRLRLDAGMCVAGLAFLDEDSSGAVVCALAPAEGGRGGLVRVWSCGDAPGGSAEERKAAASVLGGEKRKRPDPVEWSLDGDCVARLDEHRAPMLRIAANKSYLLTADTAGECRVWKKSQHFARRAVAVLHPGGAADLVVDRLFAYSTGLQDKQIGVWSLPDLQPVLTIPVEIPESMLQGLIPLVGREPRGEDTQALGRLASQSQPSSRNEDTGRIARVNLLRRPLSRWAGWQGSGRHSSVPRGSLFAAAVLGENCEVAGPGAAVLMEWSLGGKPACQSVEIAHDTPIVALVYGPYDNGPLISVDMKGVFRVWETMLDRGLCLTDQIELTGFGQQPNAPVVAVEQPSNLWVSTGTRRIYLWQRQESINF